MDYKLEELIDVNLLQSLQEKLNVIYSFPSAIIDNEGKVLTAVAWQDICTKFHRVNPESEKECIKSDQFILEHLSEANPAVSYKCPHGLIDNATPIIIDGKHLGNFFTGQFFLDEKPDIEFFKSHAEKFGFNIEEYLEAVNKVPVWTKEKLIHYLDFIKGFIEIIAGIGLKNLREIEANKKIKENELLLKEEKQRLSYILEGTNVGTWEWNIKTGTVLLNERWAEIIGYTLDELKPTLMDTWQKYAHPEDLNKSAELLQRHFSRELDFYEFESRMKHKNGSWVWVLDKGKVFEWDDNGAPVRMAGTHQDITPRKKAEEDIRISEERYALLLQNLEAGIVVHAPDTSIKMNNQRASEILGLSENQLRGKTSIDPGWGFVNENGTPMPEEDYPVNRILKYKKPIKDLLVGRRAENKTDIVWAVVNGFPTFDNNGELAEIVVSFFDVTNRKQIESELSESSERFKALHNASFGGIAIHDKGIILECNQGLSDMTGYSQKELIGMNGLLLIAPELRDLVMRNITAGYEKPYEAEGLRKNGETYPLRLEARNIPYKGKPVRTVEFRDLTESKLAEEALRRSESIKNTMVSNIGDVIVIIDKDGINKFKSPNITKLFGWTPEELIGKSTWDIVHPEDIERGIKFFASILTEPNAAGTTELRYKRKDGIYVWIEIKVINLLHDKDINGILGNYHDITDRKLAEAEVIRAKENAEESERKLKEAQEIAKLGSWELDIKKGIFTFSDNFYKIFHTTAAEMGGYQMSIEDYSRKFVHPDDASQVAEETMAAIESSDPSFTRYVEHRILYADGGVGYISVRFFIVKDENKNTIKTYGVNQDITARKLLEEKLVKSEEEFRNAFEYSPIGIALVSPEGLFLNVNQQVCDILGYSKNELLKLTFQDITHPDDLNEDMDFVEKMLNGGIQTYQMEKRYIQKRGQIAWALLAVSLVRDKQGKPLHFISQIEDITKRKQAEIELENHRNNLEMLVKVRTEELERANESLKKAVDKEKELNALKSRFISTASHELRTPITAAYMSIELIERYGKNWDQNKIDEHHKRIKDTIEQLTQIVESLLTVSRADAGKMEFKPRKTDISLLCGKLVDSLNLSDKAMHSIKLVSPKEAKLFKVDPSLINTILLNLLSNSIKYSPDGGKIELKIKDAADKLIFTVKDNGIGIPEKDIPHIFEPFHRGENINEIRGTGLGLSIVKNAVDLHGGTIRVESKAGKGTSFIIELPV